MHLKIIIFSLLLILSSNLYAKKDDHVSFLLKPNEETSFMNYEFHTLAYEAAVLKEYQDAYRIYLKLANKGDNRAEYNIGMFYMHGLGVERKKMDAYKWLRRASKHGNKEATTFFKEMTERYEKKHKSDTIGSKPTKASVPKKKEQKTKVLEKNTTNQSVPPKLEPVIKPAVKPSVQSIKNKDSENEDSSSFLYLIVAGLVVLFSLAFFFLKKSESVDKKAEKAAQSSPKYKSQMYDITYARISDYHTELLKQVNLSQLKANKKKTQSYYMFLYGVIDYFCQIEHFSDSEQRRIFSTHMGQQEGTENITAITQSILEGQRDHSMYHYQAAGGISAKAWNEDKSKDALSMLKKVLTEENP